MVWRELRQITSLFHNLTGNRLTRAMSRYGGGKSNRAVVYTDGACSNNGYDGARGGYGVHWPGHEERDTSSSLSGPQTNNRAEIQGAREAITQARDYGYKDVTIRTDSEYLHKGATEWMPKWKENGWTTSSGQPVKNRADFEGLERAAQGMNVQFEHVAAHSGDRGNDAADRLANQGAGKYGYRR